jgi:cytochrome c553
MEARLLGKAYLGLMVMAVVMAVTVGCGLGQRAGLAHGREVFKTCEPCHGTDGAGNLALRAPAIAGLPEWYVAAELGKFQKSIRGAHPDDEEGARMRPMARTLYRPGDLQAVSAYVAKLPHVKVEPVLSGDRVAGEKHYTAICVACHGPDGQGNQAMNAPPLPQQADWYLVAQLEKFKTGMRGSSALDMEGSQMKAMSATLLDTTAMRDVVAYIKSLPH